MRRLRRVGCPTGAASTVSARRACQRCASSARPEEVNAPGPACNATRHGSEASSIPGGSPVAAWPQESTRQPPRRSSYEPPSDSMWPIVPSAGRLPARHRDYGDSGTGLRLSAPTSASADHAACGSSVDGGILPPRHESLTSRIVSRSLAATGPKAAFGACHYPFRANPHPFAGRGSDRRQPHQPWPGAAPTRAEPRRPRHPFAPARLRRYARDPLSPLPVPVCQTCSRVKGCPRQHPPGRLRP